jgi:hypothetical protein
MILIALAAGALSESIHPIEVSASVSPDSIRVGAPAFLEIVVATPPDHRLLPVDPPQDLRNLEFESAETKPADESGTRWTHSVRVRFRPRETGTLAWPETVLEIEGPDGSILRRVLEPVPIEVESILPLYAGRSQPFGVRPAPPLPVEGISPARIAFGLFAAISASLALLWFRRSFARRTRRVKVSAAEKPWALALSDLGIAAATDDPAASASTTAAALRHYMHRRFGASTLAQTSEELARSAPPFAATSRWSTFTTLLLELDSVRFAPRTGVGSPSQTTRRVSELLDRSRRFVEASTPPEALR